MLLHLSGQSLLVYLLLSNLADWDAKPLGFRNLTGHTGADPAAAAPQFVTDLQDAVSQLQPGFPFLWIVVIQHLRVEQVDSDGRVPLVDGISAGFFANAIFASVSPAKGEAI